MRCSLRFPVFIALCLLPVCHAAQQESVDMIGDAMEEMVQSHPIRISFLRVRPKLVIGNVYDSDIIGSEFVEIPDYSFSVVPGGSFGIKLGTYVFVTVDEDLNFIYYRDLEQLRDFYNLTSLRFVTGSRRFLVEAQGWHFNRKGRISYEYDEPVQQELIVGELNTSFQLRPTTELGLRSGILDADFELAEGVDTSLPEPDDHRTIRYGLDVYEQIRPAVELVFKGDFGATEFYSSGFTDSGDDLRPFWQVLSGFRWNGEKLFGIATAGYGQADRGGLLGEISDFLINAELEYQFKPRTSLGIIVNRRQEVSALLQNSYRTSTQGEVRVSVPLAQKIFTDAGFLYGINDYDDQFAPGLGRIRVDNYRQFTAGLNFELPMNFLLRFGGNYLDRNSNITELTRERFILGVDVTLQYSSVEEEASE